MSERKIDLFGDGVGRTEAEWSELLKGITSALRGITAKELEDYAATLFQWDEPESASIDAVLHELTTRDGSTTALLSNILRYWSREKMKDFAEQLLVRAVLSEPRQAWIDEWHTRLAVAAEEIERDAAPVCKCADYTAAQRGQESEAGDE
jgi:hypothetical protein